LCATIQSLKALHWKRECKLFFNDYLLFKRALEAPVSLFILGEDDELMPAAIQFSEGGPVFSPVDDNSSNGPLWFLAKIHATVADVHFHQFVVHLMYTHLPMEVMCIATKRHLHKHHPLYKLLNSHFRKLLQVNELARTILMAPGAMVDQAMSTGRTGAWYITTNAFKGNSDLLPILNV
jgi:hypothetical protein